MLHTGDPPLPGITATQVSDLECQSDYGRRRFNERRDAQTRCFLCQESAAFILTEHKATNIARELVLVCFSVFTSTFCLFFLNYRGPFLTFDNMRYFQHFPYIFSEYRTRQNDI